MINRLSEIAAEDLTNRYWKLKNTPPLAKAFTETMNYTNIYKKDKIIPAFRVLFKAFITSHKVIIPKYSTSNKINVELLKSILAGYVNNIFIYTDRSKTKDGVGCGFFIQPLDLTYGYKLPDICSIYTAELVAIQKSLNWLITNQLCNAVILSDSKSVIDSIKSTSIRGIGCPVLCSIKSMLLELNVTFIWVKGHSNITGNERADLLAKDAVINGQVCNIFTSADINNTIRHGIVKKWKQEWINTSRSSTNQYFKIHPTLPPPPEYIFKFTTSKFYLSTILRLKTNHGRFPAHLAKLCIIRSSSCNCNQNSYCDLNHIFFGCLNNVVRSECLIKSLMKLNYNIPLNISHVLSSDNRTVYDLLIHFLKECNVSI